MSDTDDQERELAPDERRQRSVDVIALVAGIAVLIVCGMFAFGELDSLDDRFDVLWPLALGTVGVVLLAGVRRG